MTMREDATYIIRKSISSCLPDEAVQRALWQLPAYSGKLILIAIGKAAWRMSKTAVEVLGDRIDEGICITKYGHVEEELPGIRCFEAGHPVPDENTILATKEAENAVSNLQENDLVLFLVSGGGSALFEDPLVSLEELQEISSKLLASGANIQGMNVIRKRLSKVKGGRFARQCMPAKVYAVVLSDVVGDALDVIASGPAYTDRSTCREAIEIADKYNLRLSASVMSLLNDETEKELTNVTTVITGSVRQLCQAAMDAAQECGYEPVFLSASICCEAKEAGSFLASIAKDHIDDHKNIAFICGGETVVHVKRDGKGGRNQELALAAAEGLDGLDTVCVFSVGSDGTDGPTDAAGGYCDGQTKTLLEEKGISIENVLERNDAYHALQKCDGLIVTGPTGTNVNDLMVALVRSR